MYIFMNDYKTLVGHNNNSQIEEDPNKIPLNGAVETVSMYVQRRLVRSCIHIYANPSKLCSLSLGFWDIELTRL